MNIFKRAWLGLKAGYQYMLHFEPARLRAIWIAAAGVAATLGLGQEYANVNAKVQAAITALAILLPLLQGEATRAKVTAPGNLVAYSAPDHPAPLEPGGIDDESPVLVPIGDPDSIEPGPAPAGAGG